MGEPAAIHPGPAYYAVVRLLESAVLPTSDLTHAHMQDFFYVGPAAEPLGVVGVEFHGTDALLRSLVVRHDQRALGLGQRLVQRAEEHARNRGAGAMYLLTTTAERFFRARGYSAVSRDRAPIAIQATPEFSTLCPASSAFLFKRL